MKSDSYGLGTLERQREVANGLARKLNDVQNPDNVSRAMNMILKRIVASGSSLTVLHNKAVPDYEFDAASILRCIYDVMLQGLYIMVNSDKRDERAKLFLDFMHIERKHRIDLMNTNGTDLAKWLMNSPSRQNAEPEIQKQYEAVKNKYSTRNKKSNKNKEHKKWYLKDLSYLADKTKLKSEYELIQKILSGAIHSSPLTIEQGPLFRGDLLKDWPWRFSFRILGAYAEYKKLTLNQDEKSLIDFASKNIFDLPKNQ